MAFDEGLAARVREQLAKRSGVTERKMFGGIAFMLRGNMCCGVVKSDLMVRVGPQDHDDALAEPGARPMDFTGRPMRGMVYVNGAACANGRTLAKWVNRGANFAATLPKK